MRRRRINPIKRKIARDINSMRDKRVDNELDTALREREISYNHFNNAEYDYIDTACAQITASELKIEAVLNNKRGRYLW